MRIVGAACIMLAFIYGGFSLSHAMLYRMRFWESFITALEILRAEIRAHSSLKRAFFAAAGVSGQELFERAAEEIEKKGISAAWESAVADCQTGERDKEVLLLLASKLGRTDEQGQLRHIDYMTSIAAQMKDEAEREYRKKGVLYRRGAVLMGAFAVILLL